MKALLSARGTAMSETALCDACSESERNVHMAINKADNDWNGNLPMVDCSENTELECQNCGKKDPAQVNSIPNRKACEYVKK